MGTRYPVTSAVAKYANPEILEKIKKYVSTEKLGGEFIDWNRNLDVKKLALSVDYLIRYLLGGDEKDVFPISRVSFQLLKDPHLIKNFDQLSNKLFSVPQNLRKINSEIILKFLFISVFDQVYRAGHNFNQINNELIKFKDVNPANLHEITILVNRGFDMFNRYGIPHEIGLYFSESAFKNNRIVGIGDGDFMSKDTIWDLKVSISSSFQAKDMCQVICYWLLLKIQDKHEGTSRSKSITRLAVYNPRFNLIHFCNVSDLPYDVVNFVLREVIGYDGEI